jgi:Spy/CpxP family protein refolding chaperone
MPDARRETVKALSAAAFDRQQFLGAHAQQLEARNRARPAFLKLYIAIVEGLTPDERHGFVEWYSSRRAAIRNILDDGQQDQNTSKR